MDQAPETPNIGCIAGYDSPTPIRTKSWAESHQSLSPTKDLLGAKRCITDVDADDISDFDRAQHRLMQVAKSLRAKFARTENEPPLLMKCHSVITLDSKPTISLTKSKSTSEYEPFLSLTKSEHEPSPSLTKSEYEDQTATCRETPRTPTGKSTRYKETPRTPTNKITRFCADSPTLPTSAQKLEAFRFRAKT
ncbi:hypothetical protein K493DRAFT_309891, partial [Basidiobolus meristosporus CBS 931.73]